MTDIDASEVNSDKTTVKPSGAPGVNRVTIDFVAARALRLLRLNQGYLYVENHKDDATIINDALDVLEYRVVAERDKQIKDIATREIEERMAKLPRPGFFGWLASVSPSWMVAAYVLVAFIVFGFIYNGAETGAEPLVRNVGSFFGGLFWPIYVGGRIAIGLSRGFF